MSETDVRPANYAELLQRIGDFLEHIAQVQVAEAIGKKIVVTVEHSPSCSVCAVLKQSK